MISISVEVVPFGPGGDGPYQAGMAIVKLNGETIARLRTSETIELSVAEPAVSTRTVDHAAAERRRDA
jgi:hypothetical protein